MSQPLDPFETARRIRELDESDPEGTHREAELIVMDFLRRNGYPCVAEAFEHKRREVGFWYA